MNNVILSIIAKISAMDAENKQLAAQVEAQSLLISALMLAIGEEGGVAELVGNVTKAINSVLESSEDILKSDAELLLTKFQEQIVLTQLINTHEDKINQDALGGGEAAKGKRVD
ncbi:Anti-adapter protein IraP [Klebsiella oxytoca]|uniref:anti-adapter protein IraP n=1 Tax=Klebsiella oxytoca TaxID=571 RepID=UPI001919A902|nr:anti-adapter protein IraP [Klebsiella oxytoca]CAA0218298.1 Anti-adapter protein IraP [Klebsiella oxytoca]